MAYDLLKYIPFFWSKLKVLRYKFSTGYRFAKKIYLWFHLFIDFSASMIVLQKTQEFKMECIIFLVKL